MFHRKYILWTLKILTVLCSAILNMLFSHSQRVKAAVPGIIFLTPIIQTKKNEMKTKMSSIFFWGWVEKSIFQKVLQVCISLYTTSFMDRSHT